MMSRSKTLLPVPLRPSTAKGLAALHGQADPVQNVLSSEGLMQVLDRDDRRSAVFLGFPLLPRDLIDRV
jgi:hypothetical protein